jgi:protein-S-isoprenylcysteine O-methyltransferase Ste14
MLSMLATVLAVEADTMIPVSWFFSVVGMLLAGLLGMAIYWLKSEFRRNDEDHVRMAAEVVAIHKRIDWLIQHTPGMPKYEDRD